ncbi:hypothetical protein [Intestinibacter sp.]|uniref:hypothetical protein n=1 Tax=Intestinibacter sp. TaxID=1965304 RepID=UPI003F15659F
MILRTRKLVTDVDIINAKDINPDFNMLILVLVNNNPIGQIIYVDGFWILLKNLNAEVTVECIFKEISLEYLINRISKAFTNITFEVIKYDI